MTRIRHAAFLLTFVYPLISGAQPFQSPELTGGQRPAPASQVTKCGSRTGAILQTISFDDVREKVSKFQPKGEFESTAEYKKRVVKFGPRGTYIVEREFSKSYRQPFLSYDADSREIRISKYAFSNEGILAQDTLIAAGVISRKANAFDNGVYAVMSEKEIITGSYEGKTGFGVSVDVNVMTRIKNVIFERLLENSFTDGSLFSKLPRSNPAGQFPSTLENTGIRFRIPMDREAARQQMPQLRAAFLFEVKEPFFARAIQKPYKISRENPRDITEVVNLIFADIQCAFVINQNNKVILSVDTQ